MSLRPAGTPWWEAEPSRLERDKREIEAAFPEFTLDLTQGQGAWHGRLPMWPFERPRPDGLSGLLGGKGLLLTLDYVPAYPAVSPYLMPSDPEPLFEEWTQARWHVLGNGALCLFQTQADWDPASGVLELLMRAAGWRVEYALLKAGVREDMTLVGITNDDSLDALITETAKTAGGGTGAQGSAP